MGEKGGQMTMLLAPQGNDGSGEGSEGLKELLPGIPDAITLTHIVPKLAWRAVRILSLVSAAWQRAVHKREVYQARISAGSTETLVVLCHALPEFVSGGDHYSVHAPQHTHAMSVYSAEDKQCYQLPAIPGLKRGIPRSCQCVSLDGKVYILGGMAELDDREEDECSGCKEVYEFDVAGKWEWKRCADMQHGRLRFACDVTDEQIYVFWGRSGRRIVRQAEVYYPKADTWSSLMPIIISRFGHPVTARGEDLVVHGGEFYNPNHFRVLDDPDNVRDSYDPDYMISTDRGTSHEHHTFNLEVYHPGRNEWREVVPDGIEAMKQGKIFLAHGKLHLMSWDTIHVLDIGTDKYTLTDLHSFLWDKIGPTLTDQFVRGVHPSVTRVINGELLALADCYIGSGNQFTGRGHSSCRRHITCLLQSKGFGSENRELVWEKAACSLSFDNLSMPFICPIQL